MMICHAHLDGGRERVCLHAAALDACVQFLVRHLLAHNLPLRLKHSKKASHLYEYVHRATEEPLTDHTLLDTLSQPSRLRSTVMSVACSGGNTNFPGMLFLHHAI